jgi:large subunit ribosomal protein L9e
MVRQIRSVRELKVPADVKVAVQSRHVTVTGPRGTLKRDFRHAQLDLHVKEVDGAQTVVVELWYGASKKQASTRTILSHISNMVTGTRLGFQYKMRCVYAHFPVNTNIEDKGTRVEIRNFLGERRVRDIKMMEGVTIRKDPDVKDQILLEGNNIDNVSRSCALVRQSCMVRKKDIRKFLDGIYVSGKGTMVVEE